MTTTAITPAGSLDRFPVDPRQRAAMTALQQARAGGSPAAVRVAEQGAVTVHMGFARALANRYRHRGLDPEDLRQLAYLGLVKAVNRWDPNINDEFLVFAYPTVLGEIKRYFR